MRKRAAKQGMTLIEILIALIVMVLGVLGIMALFPPALQSGTESMEDTNAAILAESVAHSLVQAITNAEEDLTSTNLRLRATMTHDMQAGFTYGRYTFILPNLPANPLTNPEWSHFPSTAKPPGQGGSPAPGDPGVRMTGQEWDPETDDRHFQLGGDQAILETVKSVQQMNDPTDPLTQFAFSFDIRKVDDMWYQRQNGTAIDPFRKTALLPQDYENMEKLFEVRIHILRISHQGQSTTGTAVGEGPVFRRYITTVTKRITVK